MADGNQDDLAKRALKEVTAQRWRSYDRKTVAVGDGVKLLAPMSVLIRI